MAATEAEGADLHKEFCKFLLSGGVPLAESAKFLALRAETAVEVLVALLKNRQLIGAGRIRRGSRGLGRGALARIGLARGGGGVVSGQHIGPLRAFS